MTMNESASTATAPAATAAAGHWLSSVRHVRAQHLDELKAIEDINDRCKRLVELNILNSVNTIQKNPSYVEAHARGDVELYALVYDVESGYLRELPLDHSNDFSEVFHLHEDSEAPAH
ncbi:hypothetical protein PMKS-000256 [Pichia membranifaciens]|uniref:Carbonic anhydrase n=1 Tax=Pichia membranifaciens TaxID=4926 RepID=A0A1Q2YB92_9ASCO|nr:hypothetical protein PMKS-000256 [Pichia membranifaciens]